MGHHHHSHSETHEHHTLTTSEKLSKLIDHWQKHNKDHAETYAKWAAIAKAEGLEKVAELIKETARKTEELNDCLKQAEAVLEKKA